MTISLDSPQGRNAIAKISQLTLAWTWFMPCVQQHDNREDGRNDQFYPKRLIDVRGTSPRLVLFGDTTEKLSGSYAILSHRWTNSDNRSALTMEKLPQFRTAIPEDS